MELLPESIDAVAERVKSSRSEVLVMQRVQWVLR